MVPHRHSPAPPTLVTLVSCCLLAVAWGATQAQAAAPQHAAHDLRMDPAEPRRTLTAQTQTLIAILKDILDDPHGAGAPSILQLHHAGETSQPIAEAAPALAVPNGDYASMVTRTAGSSAGLSCLHVQSSLSFMF